MTFKTLGVLAAVNLLLVLGVGSGTAAAKKGFELSSMKGAYAGIFSGKTN